MDSPSQLSPVNKETNCRLRCHSSFVHGDKLGAQPGRLGPSAQSLTEVPLHFPPQSPLTLKEPPAPSTRRPWH